MQATQLPILSVNLAQRAKKSESALSALPEEALHEVEARYRKFLLLVRKYPELPLAPSKDIDEMWHLHMLTPRAYYVDCTRLFGDILDHDGGFGLVPEEGPALVEYFNTTARLWETEFGEPYVSKPEAQEMRTCMKQEMTKCTKACRVSCIRACKT